MKKSDFEKILSYDPDTGEFIWLKKMNRNGANKGDVAGYLTDQGYRKIQIGGKKYGAHRVAYLLMEGCWPNGDIDHINGIPGDNRWDNLRVVAAGLNQKNARLRSNNKSGIPGVYFSNKHGQWRAQLRVDRKLIYLGGYDDFFEACCARKSAEPKYGFHPNHGRQATEQQQKQPPEHPYDTETRRFES